MVRATQEALTTWLPLFCALLILAYCKVTGLLDEFGVWALAGLAQHRPTLRVVKSAREVWEIEREVLQDAAASLDELVSRLPDASPWRWAFRSARAEIERDLAQPDEQSDQRNVY